MGRPSADVTHEQHRFLQVPEYIEKWEDYFIWIAEVVARKSKDRQSRVGAVIVSSDGVIVSTGYNGLARGVYDSSQILDDKDEKLRWICHAEFNAIMNAVQSGIALKECTIYVNKFPCLACCNAITQAGISKVVTYDDWYWNNDPFDKNHDRKRELIRQTKLEIYAPKHPDFSPREPLPGIATLAAGTNPASPQESLISDTKEARKPARQAG